MGRNEALKLSIDTQNDPMCERIYHQEKNIMFNISCVLKFAGCRKTFLLVQGFQDFKPFFGKQTNFLKHGESMENASAGKKHRLLHSLKLS